MLCPSRSLWRRKSQDHVSKRNTRPARPRPRPIFFWSQTGLVLRPTGLRPHHWIFWSVVIEAENSDDVLNGDWRHSISVTYVSMSLETQTTLSLWSENTLTVTCISNDHLSTHALVLHNVVKTSAHLVTHSKGGVISTDDKTDLVTNYREWSTAIQSWSGDSSTACSEQNSLADTRGNGHVADQLWMMKHVCVRNHSQPALGAGLAWLTSDYSEDGGVDWLIDWLIEWVVDWLLESSQLDSNRSRPMSVNLPCLSSL